MNVTRQAFFYVPTAKPTDPLPASQDTGLISKCRLLALWYEVSGPIDPAFAQSVSADLSASLGPAAEPPSFKRTDHDWGSRYWNPYWRWESANRRVVLAVDPGGYIPDPLTQTRLVVISRSNLAPRGLSPDWTGDLPKGLPPLNEAPEGTRVTRLGDPCRFDDGYNNWPPALVRFGEKLLRDFPASPWKPYIHLKIGGALANRLLLTYAGVEPGGLKSHANPDGLRRDAIAHIRAFLEANTNPPEADCAWREAWRLLAGLPPSDIHFGCTD